MEVESIIGADDHILVTGAAGFIGQRVISELVGRGFGHIRCFVRPSSNSSVVEALRSRSCNSQRIEIFEGNLLSPEDCVQAVEGVSVIYHLAAGRGEKFVPDAFMNSVVTTRNLLEAARRSPCLKRFVTISSFSVYSNVNKPCAGLLDETAPLENQPHLRGDAYTFAKVRQDEIVADYGKKYRFAVRSDQTGSGLRTRQ